MPAHPNARSWWQPLAVFQGLPLPAPGDRTVTLQLAWSRFCPCFPPQAWLLFWSFTLGPHCLSKTAFQSTFYLYVCSGLQRGGQVVVQGGGGLLSARNCGRKRPCFMAGPFPLLLPLPSQRCRLLPAALPTRSAPHLSCPRGTYLLLSPQLGACQFGDTEVKQAGHSKQQFIGEKKMELVKLDIWDGIWLMNHCLPAQEMPKVLWSLVESWSLQAQEVRECVPRRCFQVATGVAQIQCVNL